MYDRKIEKTGMIQGMQPCAIGDFVFRIFKNTDGQGMTEYSIVGAALVAGAIATNSLVIPAINDLYELMAGVLSIPFP